MNEGKILYFCSFVMGTTQKKKSCDRGRERYTETTLTRVSAWYMIHVNIDCSYIVYVYIYSHTFDSIE